MIIDSYYRFDESTKRKASLSEFYSFCDVDYHKIVIIIVIKHQMVESRMSCYLGAAAISWPQKLLFIKQ